MTNINTALSSATQQLSAAQPAARLDAEVLLAHVLDQPRSYLYTWPERVLSSQQQQQLWELVDKRSSGEPLAYLTGRREFWSLDLRVTPGTLIPRAETELLVEQALRRIPPDRPWRVIDLGTGSGAVALALATERPLCHIIASDRCANALGVARDNAQRLGFTNVSFYCGDWSRPLSFHQCDMIVSNPPYVRAQDPHLRRGDLPYEPAIALVAGPSGLEAIGTIAAQALQCLRAGGYLLMEHGYDQGQTVPGLLEKLTFSDIHAYGDMGGKARVVCAQAPPTYA